MKKILFVINTLGKGGAETALLELLQHIDPKEWEISLYVLMGQGEMVKELPEYVKLLNKTYDDSSVLSRAGKRNLKNKVLHAMFTRGTVIRLLPYLVKNAFGMLKKGKLLPDKLLWRVLSDGGERFQEEYDIAVAYLEGGSTYFVADHVKAKKKAAFVHTDYEKAGYTRKLDSGCYMSFDRLFAVSNEVKSTFIKTYPECEKNIYVFHNLLNPERIQRKASQGMGFEDDFEGMRILSVGRLTIPKAFEVSIDAMKLLKDSGENVRWYVLGDGDQRKNLEEQVKRLGLEEDFLMPGVVDNPYPYMRQADIYVHASRYEGKSIAIQEAQILGKPILVSDCNGNREQVIAGEDGLICQLTPEDIYRDIVKLLGDEALRERLGAAAAQKNKVDESQINMLLAM